MRTLLVNGQIYSLVENFATAILVEDGIIAWIGSAGGAEVHRGDVDTVVDLEQDLVTPGFVNLGCDVVYPDAGFVHAQAADIPIANGWDEQQWQDHAQRPVAVVPTSDCRLRSRIAMGVATALAPEHPQTSGWETVRAAVHLVSAQERLTARGAFSALTRGAWRLIGQPDQGVLAVGAMATFVQWRAKDLVVESPDERISNWSTDPRSATPGLPLLQPGHPLPDVTCVWKQGIPQ